MNTVTILQSNFKVSKYGEISERKTYKTVNCKRSTIANKKLKCLKKKNDQLFKENYYLKKRNALLIENGKHKISNSILTFMEWIENSHNNKLEDPKQIDLPTTISQLQQKMFQTFNKELEQNDEINEEKDDEQGQQRIVKTLSTSSQLQRKEIHSSGSEQESNKDIFEENDQHPTDTITRPANRQRRMSLVEGYRQQLNSMNSKDNEQIIQTVVEDEKDVEHQSSTIGLGVDKENKDRDDNETPTKRRQRRSSLVEGYNSHMAEMGRQMTPFLNSSPLYSTIESEEEHSQDIVDEEITSESQQQIEIQSDDKFTERMGENQSEMTNADYSNCKELSREITNTSVNSIESRSYENSKQNLLNEDSGFNEEKNKSELLLQDYLTSLKPANRLIGEIAFQLDRRILSYIFTKCSNTNTKRFYGYTMQNIPEMIVRESTDQITGEENLTARSMMEFRFDHVLTKLKERGYKRIKHGEFSRDMVNKYGLIEFPDNCDRRQFRHRQGAALLWECMKNANIEENERKIIKIILESLLLMVKEDDGPIFLW